MLGFVDEIRTYAIEALLAALAAAVLTIVIGGLWQRHKLDQCHNDSIVAQADVQALQSANKTNIDTIAQLQVANNHLWDLLRADGPKMRAAAQRQAELETQLAAATGAAQRARAQLAKENPNAAAYLADGMPCELAQQLYGKAGYCAHPNH